MGALPQIDRLIIRDGLKCHFCHRLCDRSLNPNADLYPTRTHLIPRSEGGSSRMTNVVLACRYCSTNRANNPMFTSGKNYPESVVNRDVYQRKEWFGDALLKFYARQFCVYKFPHHPLRHLDRVVSLMVTNNHLGRFAGLKRIEGGADVVEAILYEKFEKNPDEAKNFAYEIFELYDN